MTEPRPQKFQARIALMKTKVGPDGIVYGGIRVRFEDGTERQFSIAVHEKGKCAIEKYVDPKEPRRRIVTLDEL